VADLGEDDAGAEVTDPGDGFQLRDRGANGFDVGVDLAIDPGRRIGRDVGRIGGRTRRPDSRPPANSYVVHAVLRAIDGDTLADLRDRALVAFGMAAALRRSELVALTVADLERGPDGLRVRVGRSKTDQEGRGVIIAVPDGRRLNPVAQLDAWLARAGVTEGPVFRSLVNGRVGRALTAPSVSLIVKRRAAAAGYMAADLAAHSLRAGFLTSAAAGASIWRMREVSRHKSVQVLSDYVRDSDLLKDHAGKDFL